MKIIFKRNNEVLDSAIDDEISQREEEFRNKYFASKIKSVTINFKENIILKEIQNFDNITPEDVEDMLWNLR